MESFRGGRYILCLDYDDGFMGLYICPSSTDQIILNRYSLLYINYTSIKLGKKDLQKCKIVPHFSPLFCFEKYCFHKNVLFITYKMSFIT